MWSISIDLKFNKPVDFNLSYSIQQTIKNNRCRELEIFFFHLVIDKNGNRNKKSVDTKRRVISTHSESNLPVIIKQPPVIINKGEDTENREVDEIEVKQKKKKIKRIKRTILNEESSQVDDQHPQKTCIKKDAIFISEENTIQREAIQQYITATVQNAKQLYDRNVEKAKQHRFIITGLHETIHYVKFNKAQ